MLTEYYLHINARGNNRTDIFYKTMGESSEQRRNNYQKIWLKSDASRYPRIL